MYTQSLKKILDFVNANGSARVLFTIHPSALVPIGINLPTANSPGTIELEITKEQINLNESASEQTFNASDREAIIKEFKILPSFIPLHKRFEIIHTSGKNGFIPNVEAKKFHCSLERFRKQFPELETAQSDESWI